MDDSQNGSKNSVKKFTVMNCDKILNCFPYIFSVVNKISLFLIKNWFMLGVRILSYGLMYPGSLNSTREGVRVA